MLFRAVFNLAPIKIATGSFAIDVLLDYEIKPTLHVYVPRILPFRTKCCNDVCNIWPITYIKVKTIVIFICVKQNSDKSCPLFSRIPLLRHNNWPICTIRSAFHARSLLLSLYHCQGQIQLCALTDFTPINFPALGGLKEWNMDLMFRLESCSYLHSDLGIETICCCCALWRVIELLCCSSMNYFNYCVWHRP